MFNVCERLWSYCYIWHYFINCWWGAQSGLVLDQAKKLGMGDAAITEDQGYDMWREVVESTSIGTL